jgi:5-methylcytosine-specific restriction endonuclease McrA
MNKLPLPDVDDLSAVHNVADNRRLQSFPHLRPVVNDLHVGYAHYHLVGGNAEAIVPMALDEAVQGYLRSHYNSPPAALSFISRMRREDQQRICPMCGSKHRHTLDHLLPKEDYPEFAIFSANLVPACKCNTDRGQTVKGDAVGERVLHPYFDECMSRRLIAARFDDLGHIPRISLRILLNPDHQDYTAVAFHVRTVVEKGAILERIKDCWVDLCRLPRLKIRALERIPRNVPHLREILNRELEMVDEENRGRNSWDSVFVAGLLDVDVTRWLFERLTAPGRAPNDPLTTL